MGVKTSKFRGMILGVADIFKFLPPTDGLYKFMVSN